MGMEGFNNTVPEPARPEDEGRIDDVEKAQEMADAERPLRDYAAQYDRAKDTPIDDGGRMKSVKINNNRPGQNTNISMQKDGSLVEYAGSSYNGFDKNMSDEEVRGELSKRSEDAKKQAENIGDVAGEEFEKEKQAKLEEVKKDLGIE